jgi:hypothetical protein
MVRFFALIRVRMVFLRAIRGRRAGCDVRVFIFVFLSSPKGCGKSRSRDLERNFFARAGGIWRVVFAPRCERRSRDFRKDLRLVDIRSRERVESCARGAMVPARLLDERERAGVTQSAVFHFFSFHFTHFAKLFLSFSQKTPQTAIAKDV